MAEISVFWLLSYAAIFLLLISTAFISGSEAAFFSLKASDLDRYRSHTSGVENSIITLMHEPRRLLATILILNNAAMMGIVTLSTFLMWDMVGTRQPTETAVGIVTLITTVVISFFGEIVPKVYAARHYWGWARRVVYVWIFLCKITSPFSWALIRMTGFVEKRMKVRGYNATIEELNQALDMTIKQSTQEERTILKGIVNFGTLSAKQVMKSRVDISSVDVHLNFHELLQSINQTGYSRCPVTDDSLDKIIGILFIKDLLPHLNEAENFDWKKLLRPVFFVPETKKLDSLLKDFQSKRVHMAIVVDEYGGTSGLVTLEDLLEEIVGEIHDEFDEIKNAVEKIAANEYKVDGKMPVHDLCKLLSVPADYFDSVRGENETIGGLITEMNHALPQANDVITFMPFKFTVLSIENKRVLQVRIKIEPTP